MEVFKHSAGIDVQHIPYRGDAPVNAALIGGEIQLAVVPQSTGLPFIKSGSIRAARRDRHQTLAGAARGADHRGGRRRRPRSPELERPVRAGRHAPRDRHDDPEGRRGIDGLAEVRDRILAMGQDPIGGTPEEFDALFKSDLARFAKVIEQAKIQRLDWRTPILALAASEVRVCMPRAHRGAPQRASRRTRE